jgi:hypothetical protein
MPDYITRKRLKQKVLERWENEGGKISADPTVADESSPTGDRESGGNQPHISHDNSTVGAPTSPSKKRKPIQK